jgi:hypothetical protein
MYENKKRSFDILSIAELIFHTCFLLAAINEKNKNSLSLSGKLGLMQSFK